MNTRYVIAIGVSVFIWAFFLFDGSTVEATNGGECRLRIRGPLEAGDMVVKVRGGVGSQVTLRDNETLALLGSGTLEGSEVCRGSAEIALSQPLVGEQIILATDDQNNEARKWVFPPLDPSIAIMPHCSNSGHLDSWLYGWDWPNNETVTIRWEGQTVDTVTVVDEYFALPMAQNNLSNGVYEISASANGYTTTTLFEVPCPHFGNSALIEGTTYVNTDGMWVPASFASVSYTITDTQYAGSIQSGADGYYQIWTSYADSHAITSCVEIGGAAYAATASNVIAPAYDVDLYLEATGSAECSDDPIYVEPPDLTIGTPIITPIDSHSLSVTVTISNTSSVTVTQPFYVDAATRRHVFNYVRVQGMLPYSSMEVAIPLQRAHPFNNEQVVYVMVDGAHEIVEFDEENNTASNSITPPNQVESVAVYLLAFDNPSYSAGNLSPQLPETLKGIRAATLADNSKLAVVLADLDKDGDTHIMTVYNGNVEYFDGLPNTAGVLDKTLKEYDMSDGNTLGGFLRWARQNFPAPQTSLFVYAHGAPVVPETNISDALNLTTTANARSSSPIPLPMWIYAHPDLTDMHPVGLLSPYDLRVALDAATDGGNDKFDVVDLVHCFSLSIEEAYEIAPYTDAISGSPNYAYFDADLPGAALAATSSTMDGHELADAIIATYDAELPASGYPRLMAALDASQLEETKIRWDVVSAELLNAFDINYTETRNKISAAYQQSAKYDTTYCNPDWELAPPDALSDMYEFAFQLEQQFGEASSVGIAARDAINALATAITSRHSTDGIPHFTEGQVAPHWHFSGWGVALFTDLGGVPANGATQLSWQSEFYTNTVSAENPHPYRFISNQGSWADVFTRYWQGVATTQHGCVATFPPVRDSGELAIGKLLNPKTGEAALNTPLRPSIQLQAVGELGNVSVQFIIVQNGSTVYSDTVGTGRIFTGTHWVNADRSWTPTTTDAFSLTVTVDPENYVDETDETDNQVTFADSVSAEGGIIIQPETTLANGQQWITDLTAPLILNAGRLVDTELDITAYQFSLDGHLASPFERGANSVTTAVGAFQVPLGAGFSAGVVELHIWEVSDGERSQLPTALRLNYIPANTPISTGETHCFLFDAVVGDQIQIRLNVPNNTDANLFVWYPHSFDAPDLIGTRVGDDDLLLEHAPTSGEYLLCVQGVSTTHGASSTAYTLSVVENGETLFTHPTTPENDSAASVPESRILYEDPAPKNRSVPSAVSMSEHSAETLSTAIILFSLLLAVITVGVASRRIRQ